MIKPIDKIPGFAPTRREEQRDQFWIVYVKPPAMFGLPEQSLHLTDDQYRRYKLWRDGSMMIQEALPDLSPSQREILMSGLGDEDFHRFAGDANE